MPVCLRYKISLFIRSVLQYPQYRLTNGEKKKKLNFHFNYNLIHSNDRKFSFFLFHKHHFLTWRKRSTLENWSRSKTKNKMCLVNKKTITRRSQRRFREVFFFRSNEIVTPIEISSSNDDGDREKRLNKKFSLVISPGCSISIGLMAQMWLESGNPSQFRN